MNKSGKYAFSSLLYLGYITFSTTVHTIVFGLTAGFQYYFFNLSGLIMFTNWSKSQKLMGAIIQGVLFISLFFYSINSTPLIELNYSLTIFFHTLNVILNILGVSNSANYYINIATKSYGSVMNLAMKDYLTNLMNRTSFDEFMDDMFVSRKMNRGNLGILLLDIDHFKNINDTCGHLCGDELLKQFASVLMENIRDGDFAARYGGEEFVIIARIDDEKSLIDFSERIRQHVEKSEFGCSDNYMRISVSIGALFISKDSSIDKNMAIEMTDQLLYQAKSNGRNQVVSKSV